ncbi:hypothetical protein HHL22_04810 [Hymenobacter sp. RP-2-7]|uniref:Uncharacterized protein n=1 Tax=Hymenobacter polaris TaxID=2682546 RepID=A0A7Y0ABY2_9BACT|nr:hypothetical protein [Hymenobacter polaris]NML64519.1 hypothetical protein [Hymenobacter polaris]
MRFQLKKKAGVSALAFLLAAGVASCNSPTQPAGSSVTLPAGAEAQDSVKASLTAPAPDAVSTSADSTAARSSVTPR